MAAKFVHSLAALNPSPPGGTSPRHQRKRCPAPPPARPRCHRRVSRRTQHPHTAASAAARAAFQGSCPQHAPESRSSGTCACRTAGARRQTAALMLMLLLMRGRGWRCALHAVVRLLHGSLDEVHGDTLVPCVAGSARCAALAPAPRRSWRTDVPTSSRGIALETKTALWFLFTAAQWTWTRVAQHAKKQASKRFARLGD